MPTVSIVVPVYNTANYLHKCLDSILAQDYGDFELLLIDDGSTDSSGQICDSYASLDNRVKVYHKSNGGVSAARNFGISQSKGKWVAFIDSDDYVESSYLNNLLNKSVTEVPVDLVISNIIVDAPEGTETCYELIVKQDRLYDTLSQLLANVDLMRGSAPMAKLFRLDVIHSNNVLFPEGIKLGEDTCFMFRYLKHSRYIQCTSEVNYHIVWRLGSASQQRYPFLTEYAGYRENRQSIMSVLESKDLIADLASTYVSWSTYFLHRALMAISSREELCSVTEDDWGFFFQYFNPQTRKTKLDMYIFRKFRHKYAIVIAYLKSMKMIRNTVASLNMWKLMSLLRK